MKFSKKDSEVQDSCPACRSSKFAVAKDITMRRYCSECGHIWLPRSKDQILIQGLQDTVSVLKSENASLQNELAALKKEKYELTEKHDTPETRKATLAKMKNVDLFE